jgi:hypothetical protein
MLMIVLSFLIVLGVLIFVGVRAFLLINTYQRSHQEPGHGDLERKRVATYLIVLSVISAVLLLVSIPFMMFMYMGVGMSPGAPHMSYSEFLLFGTGPMLIVIIQTIIIRAGQFRGVALGFNKFVALFAAVELFLVVAVKAAG